MANNLQKVHGGAQPVFAIDTRNGSVAPSAAAAGVPTNFIGPAMDFFGIDLGADPAAQLVPDGAVEAVLKTIGQLATVMMYQVEASANANNMSVAVYPAGAWTTVTLADAIKALGTVNTYDLSGAAVTNVGFKLAAA